MASEILAGYSGDDQLSETCASLISQMGKLKRMGMGWEDKTRFFEFYKGKGSVNFAGRNKNMPMLLKVSLLINGGIDNTPTSAK